MTVLDWKDVKPFDKVSVVGATYRVRGQTVVWSGEEALDAQRFLNSRAKGTHSKKGKLRR
jgi:hypothetical protein